MNYGYISQTSSGPRKTVVFSVTQTRDTEPKLVHLSLTAPSEKAVRDFHAKSWVLNKELSSGENILEREGDVVLKAETRDFDGNMLEAIFDSRRSRGERRSSGTGREVEVEPKEAKRVLEWQEEVARSVAHTERSSSRGDGEGGSRAPHHTIKRADSYPLPTRAQVVKRETITTSRYRIEPPIKKPAETDSGLSGTAVFGTLLGAAALAGVAYALRRSSSPETIPARRASEGSRVAYTHAPQQQGVTERAPARTYVSEREKDREGEQRDRASPRYVQYTIAAVPTAASRVHEMKWIDERSRHSSVHEVPRSERGGIEMVDHEVFVERPRTILPEPSPDRSSPREREIERERETDRESHVSRRSHRSHRSHRSGSDESPRSHGSHSGRGREREREKEKLYHVEEEAERESSYTSARSHHTVRRSSTSTVRPIPPPPPTVPVPPPAASMVSTSTVRKVRREHGHERGHGHREDREKDGSSSSGREKEHSGRRRRRESHSHSHSQPHHEPPPEPVVYQPMGSHSHTGSDRSRARRVPLPESVAGASDWERGSVRLVSGLGREYNEYLADQRGGGEGGGGGGGGGNMRTKTPVREEDRQREKENGVDPCLSASAFAD